MSYHEEDFADMLFAWPAVDGRITYLYELDPTHVIAQTAEVISINAERTTTVLSAASTPSLCVLTDTIAAAVLLELDPTHTHAG